MQVQIVSDDGTLLWRLADIEDFDLNKSFAREVLAGEFVEALERIKNNPDYEWVE